MLTSLQVSYKEIGVFEMLRLPTDLFNKSLKIQTPNANMNLTLKIQSFHEVCLTVNTNSACTEQTQFTKQHNVIKYQTLDYKYLMP